jgi:hypothetical protein
MIRGLLIFFLSLILLSASQFKHSWTEKEPLIQPNNSIVLFAAEPLSYEPAEHPGQLGNIRLLKHKTSKLRTTNSNFWFITEGTPNQFRFNFFLLNIPADTHASGKICNTNSLPIYLELNKIII